MILWCDGGHTPAENMRRDAALLARASAEPGFEAVLRVYRFEPHGVTLGHAQRPEQVLDLDRCRLQGVPWAVRPTGGRAIFHAAEWTYALACRIEDPVWGGSLARAYETASRLLLAALRRLGVPAELARGRREDGVSAACFASTARHELTVEGRKLVGSAQRRTSRGLLQQGSVLLGPGHEELAALRPVPPEAREIERQRLRDAAATAGAYLGADRDLTRWAAALEAQLGPGVRRHDGAAGAVLLTPPETHSYTPSA